MTPAIKLLTTLKIEHQVHQYQHDPRCESYGDEAVSALGVPAQQVFKTLVVTLSDQSLSVALVPVAESLNLKAIAKANNSKKASMADKQRVERVTGYVLGGVSPLGQKNRLTTVIDASALTFETVYISAGKRGLEIQISPNKLAELLEAKIAPISAKT